MELPNPIRYLNSIPKNLQNHECSFIDLQKSVPSAGNGNKNHIHSVGIPDFTKKYFFTLVEIECSDYAVLNEDTRNKNYKKYNGDTHYDLAFCDKSSSSSTNLRPTSPSWKGAGWYRFQAPAGTRMPENPPEFSHYTEGFCGTHYTGWLNGHHPTNLGELVEREVCFKTGGSENCRSSLKRTTKIRHCGSYFVYYLNEVSACSLRYCAE